jgi:signal peptidase I
MAEEKFEDGPVFKKNDITAKETVEEHEFKGDEWTEIFKTIAIAFAVAMVVRTLLFEPFNIPSGSMKPGLLVGDYLFVTKYSYGYSQHSVPFSLIPFEGRINGKEPKRGDVAVFKLPTNPRTDFIKRVIGLPGDTIQMIGGRLYINGSRVEREFIQKVDTEKKVSPYLTVTASTSEYVETLPNGVTHTIFEDSDNGQLDNTNPVTVPEGHYFMMGDNRDNSQDSRVEEVVGFVPFENFVGRAERLFFSLDEDARVWQIWKWPVDIRFGRIWHKISP